MEIEIQDRGGGWEGTVGAEALQDTWDLLKRRAGLTIKPAAGGMHHGPGFIPR